MIKNPELQEVLSPEVQALEDKILLLLQVRTRYEMALRVLANFKAYDDEDASTVALRARNVAVKALDK